MDHDHGHEPTLCAHCNKELEIGDYPFCPHGSIYEQSAKRFDPIVLHKGPNGEYSFPGNSSDPVPAGYEKIEITNIRQADRYVREIDSKERSKMFDNRENNRLYFEEKTRERRQQVDALLQSGKLSNRARMLAEKAREYADKKHDRRFSSTKAFSPNFHIQALSFDVGNRMPYAGPDTSYRDRKS